MHMERINEGGYTWTYCPAKGNADKAIIVSLGDSDHDRMAKGAAKYILALGCNVLAIDPSQPHHTGCHSFPLECVEAAAKWLKQRGNTKIGIAGGSTTGMLSLVAAAYVPDISLVLAYTPCDFVMQGFFKGKKDGYIPEWPAPGESTVTWRGEPVPYAPYDMNVEDYYNATYGKVTKEHGELCGLDLFSHVERKPLPEEVFIPVEHIRGDIVVFGAEDDTLWYTAKYIRRMERRLKEKGFSHRFEPHIYEKGTHFIFPQGMMERILPVGSGLLPRMFVSGKKYPKECKAARIDVDRATAEAVRRW